MATPIKVDITGDPVQYSQGRAALPGGMSEITAENRHRVSGRLWSAWRHLSSAETLDPDGDVWTLHRSNQYSSPAVVIAGMLKDAD